jgi:ankyrin repeat protein
MSNHEPFIAAVKAGDTTRVSQLIDRDPSVVNAVDGGVSAILTAIYNGHAPLAHLLAERGAPVGFFEACALGDLDGVRRMLSGDPSMARSHSSDGFAALGFATFFGHPEIDRLLLDQGADIHAQSVNAMRVCAVHAAAAVCDHDMMELLLRRGADPNARQQADYTPLHTAAGRGDVRMATLLLAHGADRDARGTDGQTPADVARARGQATFAEWLASYQPDA